MSWMTTIGLDLELDRMLAEVEPPLIDLEQLERLATEDELHTFDGECTIHDSCRQVR